MSHPRTVPEMKSDEKSEEMKEENLWIDILSQVQESSPNKLPSGKSVLVLGDNESGKTSLVAKLQGNEDPRKGSGLEYHYIYVRDEYREDHTRLGVWVLDGDSWHRNLLKFVLNEESYPHTTVLLTAAMTQPWCILDSLKSWTSLLKEHINRLKISKELLKQQEMKVLKRYQEYVEPGSEIDGVASQLRSGSSVDTNSSKEIQENLGLEIIVVITKTDYMSTLEKEFDFKEEHFDFIQFSVRNFCLLYGASLFYVSVKEDKNCDVLSKYLVNKIYNFPFRTPALVVEKDAVFIPAGWDNLNKISILEDNLTSMKSSHLFHDVIVKPISRKPMLKESEVAAEDDQLFLCQLQNQINQQAPATGARTMNAQDTPIRAPPGVQKTADRRISGSPGVQASPKKLEGKAGTVGSEGVLQNFFNSLLNRRTGPSMSPLSVRSPSDKTIPRQDGVTDIDRSSRSKKSPSFGQASETSDGSNDTSPAQS